MTRFGYVMMISPRKSGRGYLSRIDFERQAAVA